VQEFLLVLKMVFFNKSFVLLTIVSVLMFSLLFSQEAEKDKNKTPKKDLKLIFSTTHSSFSNWQGGGSTALSFSCKIDGNFRNISERWDNEHDIEFGIGVLKQDGNSFQKSEDLIHYSYGLGYSPKKDSNFSFFFDFDFRSQFASGYNYKSNPFEGEDFVPVRVSDIFSPTYLTQSLNISFKKDKWFRSSLGLGLKEIIVERSKLRQLYGLKYDEMMKVEFGVSSKVKVKKEVFRNVNIDSQLSFFLSVNPVKKPDIRWNNKVDLKFNSWLLVRFELEMFYDDEIIDKVQIREVMSLGLTLELIKSKKKKVVEDKKGLVFPF